MPALGHTITVDAIRAEYAKAVDQGKVNEFKRAYLNQWVPRDAPDLWSVVPERTWAGAGRPGVASGGPGGVRGGVRP